MCKDSDGDIMKHGHNKILAMSMMAVVSAAMTGCGSESSTECAARELGALHASELCEPGRSSQQLHYMLLNVRAKEWEMRSHGMEAEADRYIAAFENEVRARNDSLAALIF